MCQLSHTLKALITRFDYGEISILDYKLYIDDSKTPIIIKNKSDYEPYLNYYPLYLIEDSSFNNIRYTKTIRLISPKSK